MSNGLKETISEINIDFREFLILSISLVVIFCILSFLAIFVIWNNPVDFILQVGAGVDIANGEMLYRDIGILEYNNRKIIAPQYPPLYLYTLGFLYSVFGIFTISSTALIFTKLFLTLFLILDALLLYYLLRSRVSFKINYLIMLLFLFHPTVIGNLTGFHENFLIFFLLIATIFFDKKRFYLCGVFLGFALLVKPISVILGWAIFIFILIDSNSGRKEKLKEFFKIAGPSSIVFGLGLLPFLLVVPEKVISDVFLIHFTRDHGNLSFFYYFGQFLDKTGILLLFQIFSQFLILFFFILLKNRFINWDRLLLFSSIYMISLVSFYLLNRIFYPHYFEQILPWTLISLILLYYQTRDSKIRNKWNKLFYIWILFHVISLLGAGIWGIIWTLDLTPNTMNDNILYSIGSFIFEFGFIGFLIVFVILVFSLYTEIPPNDSINTL